MSVGEHDRQIDVKRVLMDYRNAWVAEGATCHWCGGPSFPWLTDDVTWAKVERLLGQQQACFECFVSAWMALGFNSGEPFAVKSGAELAAVREERDRLREALQEAWERIAAGDSDGAAEIIETALAGAETTAETE